MGSTYSSGFQPRGEPLNFHVERWLDENTYETLAMCRTFSMASAAFQIGKEDPINGYLLVRQRARVILDSRRSE